MMNNKIKTVLSILLIVLLFVAISYIVHANLDFFRRYIGSGFVGIITYILLMIIGTVIAPISDLPLMPVALAIWDWRLVALFSIIGWTIGAVIAFILARLFGMLIVSKLFSLEKIHKYDRFVPKHHMFWGIVFLRILVPVDVLSYVLGLFSRIKLSTYFIATFIGVAPMAIIFAYFGSLPIYIQIIAAITFGLIVLFAFLAWWLGYHSVRKE